VKATEKAAWKVLWHQGSQSHGGVVGGSRVEFYPSEVVLGGRKSLLRRPCEGRPYAGQEEKLGFGHSGILSNGCDLGKVKTVPLH